ncbi:uncharacterized protein FTJAE_2180 [Fusarium tjaetaba]|uniref:Uncharacterized protein n=1 Tax=Fusarium tjaetaba TaxID=1567544 RepID=A0A8H5S3U9_9HYPO|nr:uncharacterized protein FTJAE_2180 [Fusarium tjaetaba]KAF5646091.1 hypothetical protein FTJAE_2180 [Fusarium tjaetaba]
MGARFDAHDKIRSLEDTYIGESKGLLLADLENICIENVQTCILIANLYAAHLNPSSEALFFRKWYTEIPLRRLLTVHRYWCQSAANHGSRRSSDETELRVPWQPGLWAHKISLVRLFGPIKDLNHRSVHRNIGNDEIESTIASLSAVLQDWEQTIPSCARMSMENLERHIEEGHGGAFIAIHLGYHHYATLLYFRFLEPTASSSPLAAIYQANLDEDVQPVRDALKPNFEAILELRRYWPNTESMMHRLVTFQNYCLLSSDYRTHTLDGWMLRFLIQYSLPLGEKELAPVTAGMDLDMDSFEARAQEVNGQGKYTAFDTEALTLDGVNMYNIDESAAI